jgi:hypothetical protein
MEIYAKIKEISSRFDNFDYEKCKNSGTGYTYPYESEDNICCGYDKYQRLNLMFKVKRSDEIISTFLIHQRYTDDKNIFAIYCDSNFIDDCVIRNYNINIVLDLLNGDEIVVGDLSFKII